MKENQTSYTDQNYPSRDKYNLIETASQVAPTTMLKRIGSTTYEVAVHFSGTSKETINDKITRMIRSEVNSGKVVEQ